MRFTDFRTIKRGLFLLVLTGVSLSYIQLIATEQWNKFVHFRIRISRSMHVSDSSHYIQQTTPDINMVYFDFNESVAVKNMRDVYNDNSPDVYNGLENESDDTEEDEIDIDKVIWGQDATVQSENETKAISEKNTNGHSRRRNRFATIALHRFIKNDTNFTTKPLMILFSSWVTDHEKANVHAVLRRLWNSWSSIKPVVLTKDQVVQQECKKAGWDFQTVTNSDSRCYGPPVLTSMFTDVLKSHDAYFYGYSNADIIFGDGLEKTMKFLYYNFSPWKSKPILVVGRRHNVDFIQYKNFTLETPEDVKQLTKYGKLVIRSTDYFFTNRHFPWGQAPKVTIGRPYVVRAIIGWALQKGYYVIDATNTIESVHLTTEDGVFASWHKKGVMCNERVLAALRWSVPTSYGHCECARLETFHGKNNTIKMRHRPSNKKYCGR